ncbi:hypothetical protein ACQ859_22575 [Roseateles chitinivorans]|uniref:hypothetical protein n=1 Tax=Roseateles chitinivorans TaxID=2917965 RepID=UPI003D6705A4
MIVDAAVLRPLIVDAAWHYRGIETQANAASPILYDTTTQHLANGTGKVFETATNAGNRGADQVTLRVESGTVTADEGLDLAPGLRVLIQRTELKSPVRAGEQYNIHDRRIEDVGIDVDGDRRNDAMDVAVYARVVGWDTVALPSLPSVRALRVDTTLLTRVRGTVTNLWSDVTRIETKAWFAEGLGMVQLQSDVPAMNGKGATRTVETLLGFDGGSIGLGASAAIDLRVPLTSATFPGGWISASDLVAAIPMDDQALLFESRLGGELAVYRMNARGSITGVHHHLGQNAQPRMARYARVGSEVLVVSDEHPALRRFDANGQLIGTVDTLPLSRPGRSDAMLLQAVAYGQSLGLLWSRKSADGSRVELVMGRFASDGTPAGTEVVIFTGADVHADARASALGASGGRMVATWAGRQTFGNAVDIGVAAWAPDSGELKQLVLANAVLNSSQVAPTVVSLQEGVALLWGRALANGDPLPDAAGVRLDAQFNPVRGAAGIDEEILRGLPGSPINGRAPAFQTQGQRIVGWVNRVEPIWPDLPSDPYRMDFTRVSWWEVGPGALSGAQVKSIRVGRGGEGANAAPVLLTLGDRLLMLGGNQAVNVRTLWLPTGR